MRRVMITGMGCVTPYGAGVDAYWGALTTGRSAITPLTAFDPTPYATRIAGQIQEFRPRDYMPQREITGTARVVQLGIAAARMAVEEAKLPIPRCDPCSSDLARRGLVR